MDADAGSAPRYLNRYTDQTGEAMRPVLLQATIMATAVALAACTPAPRQTEEATPPEDAARGWSRTPRIDQVRRDGDDLVFTGVAESGARVVLRNDADAAFAAVADVEGRFEIRMAAPGGELWLRPETQMGQVAAVSPDLLLIIAGGQGPIVLLRPGAATRRLDRAPALGAIDSDGRIRRLSGRTTPGIAHLVIEVDGAPLAIMPDAQGRWNAVTVPETAFQTVIIDGQSFSWPGEGAQATARSVERAGAGWRIHWPMDGGHQVVWAPDEPQPTP